MALDVELVVIRRRKGALCGVAAMALIKGVPRNTRDAVSFILVVIAGIGMAMC